MGTPTDTDYRMEQLIERDPEGYRQHVRQSNLATAERRNKILRLRRMGLAVEQIAEALAQEDPPIEMAPHSVGLVIAKYVADLRAEDYENAEVIRQLEVERLDRMFARLEEDVRGGDATLKQRAIRTQLQVMERRARLLGLDAPQKLEHSGTIDAAGIASPDHVRQVEAEFTGRFDFELPAGEVEELPDIQNPESDAT